MVKSLEQINAEFRQQKKERRKRAKAALAEGSFGEIKEEPAPSELSEEAAEAVSEEAEPEEVRPEEASVEEAPVQATANKPWAFLTKLMGSEPKIEPVAEAEAAAEAEETVAGEDVTELEDTAEEESEGSFSQVVSIIDAWLVSEDESESEEPVSEEAVLQELELSLLYGVDILTETESVSEEEAAFQEAEMLEGERYRPRSLSDIEHEFKEQMGRGRRENAPKTVHYRQVVSGFSNVIYYALMLLLVLTAWLYAQEGRLFIFGNYQMHTVLSSSMESVYPKGTLLFAGAVDPNELVVGNDIVFYRDATTTIVHRIIHVHEDFNDSGQRAFTTKGVNNEHQDFDAVLADKVVGKVDFFIPHVGGVMRNMHNQMYLIVIFVIAGICFSLFLNMTFGETRKERRQRKARAVLREGELEI